jgi:hypothetical protein
MNPPIRNIGIKGIKFASKELLKWPEYFNDHALRMNLFNLYIFVEVGGTGGGCFRYMYSRFLKESAAITGNKKLLSPAEKLNRSGKQFSGAGLLFKESLKAKDLNERIKKAGNIFDTIYEVEAEAWSELSAAV